MSAAKSVSPPPPDDRRASLRVQARLPFQWQPLASREELKDLITRWGLAHHLEIQQSLATLDGQLERAMHDVRDPAVTTVLRLLDDKLDLIARSVRQDVERQIPRAVDIELSAEGMAFNHPSPLPVGTLIGVHLVLPAQGPSGVFHLLCTGRTTAAGVRHPGSATVSSIQSATGDGNHLGVQFLDLPPAASRRLTRFVISTQSTA
ncbi:MAG: PilZ domain-containing protein [Pseudomonadales bacterium]|nr:PilZ domain-containing protein [Pseudomonadales bacterium]